MTRRCGWCKRHMGEKCPECGGVVLSVIGFTKTITEMLAGGSADDLGRINREPSPTGRNVPDPLSDRVYKCMTPSCGETFIEGAGGVTHGMCDDCIQRRNGPDTTGQRGLLP